MLALIFIYVLIALGVWLALVEAENDIWQLLIAVFWPLGLGYVTGRNLRSYDEKDKADKPKLVR